MDVSSHTIESIELKNISCKGSLNWINKRLQLLIDMIFVALNITLHCRQG